MKRLFLFSVLCLGAVALFGTHNRSGYIRVEQIGEFAIEAVIITLTDSNSQPADRDTLTICWGDGSTERVARNPEATQILQNNVQRNMYVARHTYEQKGTFTVCMTDPNRNSGILNVNAPNSGRLLFICRPPLRWYPLQKAILLRRYLENPWSRPMHIHHSCTSQM